MRKYIYISIGGFVGATGRYALRNWHVLDISNQFHIDTIFINILGCFTLALFLRLAYAIGEVDSDLRLGITTGFIGAFTTFSTVCKEIVGFLFNDDILFFIINMVVSIATGLAAVYLGEVCAKEIIKVHGKLKYNPKISK
jgi:fluoride exporter